MPEIFNLKITVADPSNFAKEQKLMDELGIVGALPTVSPVDEKEDEMD